MDRVLAIGCSSCRGEGQLAPLTCPLCDRVSAACNECGGLYADPGKPEVMAEPEVPEFLELRAKLFPQHKKILPESLP